MISELTVKKIVVSPKYLRRLADLMEALQMERATFASFGDWLNHLKWKARGTQDDALLDVLSEETWIVGRDLAERTK